MLQHVYRGYVRWRVCRDLIGNIYSREVSDEHLRRCAEARGKPWSSGVIPEFFLGKVLGEDQHHSMTLPLELAC